MSQNLTNSPNIDYSRKWLVLAAVASSIFLATVDGSIVNIALPTLEKELGTQFSVVQWVVLAYLLTMTTLMLAVGRLADMFGKKKLFVAGLAIFTVGSTLCGFSNSIYMLIASRVLQALGAAMSISLGPAITTESFPAQERGKALGITGTMVSLGSISGPAIGGLLLGSFSWHWIFFVNIPIGIIGVIISSRFIPDIRPGGREKFDLPGALILFVSLFSFLMGLTLGQDLGWSNGLVLGLAAVFVVGLFGFTLREKSTSSPLIDFKLFSNNLFSVNLITGFATFVCGTGISILMPFYLQNVKQYRPDQMGLLLGAFPLAMGVMAPLAGSLSDRFGSRRLTAVGLGALLAAYIGISTLTEGTSILGYVLRFVPLGLGMGLFQSPNNSAVMGAVPKNRLGVASSLLSLTRTIGQTTGIAVMGAVWAGWVATLLGHATGDATAAPVDIQVFALQRTLWVCIVLISLAFLLSLWALWKERKQ
jgi:EmrB/QacA subfamily drug resistance transporter